MSFEPARRVADAVLLEGYVLYPYRASAVKNRMRWQFGVLAPPGATTSEPTASQTECLIESATTPTLELRARFLRVRARVPAAGGPDGQGGTPRWDEGDLQEIDASVELAGPRTRREVPFTVAGEEETSDGVTFRGREVSGLLTVEARRMEGPYGLTRVRARLENRTPDHSTTREDMLRSSMVASHLLLRVRDGAFVSLLEPPEWAIPAARSCENLHTWPVLVGDPDHRDLVLSSPIILYDHPETAPESPADLCDATEIDEILTLRTMALTEAEKREARATDPRAARIVDGVDAMPPETLERLHGALRYVERATVGRASDGSSPEPFDRPREKPSQAAPAGGGGTVEVAGGTAARGSRVWLRPGGRRADAQDMFLRGRAATVEGIFVDLEGARYLAVSLDDDPGTELHQWHGRYLYFAPEEVELREDS